MRSDAVTNTGPLAGVKVIELGGIGRRGAKPPATAHLTARATVIDANAVEQAAPAPRFSRTPAGSVGPPPAATTPLDEIGW